MIIHPSLERKMRHVQPLSADHAARMHTYMSDPDRPWRYLSRRTTHCKTLLGASLSTAINLKHPDSYRCLGLNDLPERWRCSDDIDQVVLAKPLLSLTLGHGPNHSPEILTAHFIIRNTHDQDWRAFLEALDQPDHRPSNWVWSRQHVAGAALVNQACAALNQLANIPPVISA